MNQQPTQPDVRRVRLMRFSSSSSLSENLRSIGSRARRLPVGKGLRFAYLSDSLLGERQMPEIETRRLRLCPITLDDLLTLVNLQWALLIERVRMAEVEEF